MWFSPEMFEKGQQETFDYLVKAAAAAESLRRRWPNLVLPGLRVDPLHAGYSQRGQPLPADEQPLVLGDAKAGKFDGPLNAFLTRANEAVRQVFHGQVTYFSVPFEKVDWGLFDCVGVDLYRDARMGSAVRQDGRTVPGCTASRSSSASSVAAPTRAQRSSEGWAGPWMFGMLAAGRGHRARSAQRDSRGHQDTEQGRRSLRARRGSAGARTHRPAGRPRCRGRRRCIRLHIRLSYFPIQRGSAVRLGHG